MALILGIETSCDETAAAIVADGRIIHSQVVASQIALHAQYGGVFPEMASREHVLKIVPVIQQTLHEAQVTWSELAAIAVTYGPGLAGSLLVGVNMTKGLALAKNLPLIGVNHLEGHIYASWLTPQILIPFRGDNPQSQPPIANQPLPEFPLVCLIVSGGHTELILMRDHADYQLLGATRDDAAGEAFDKVARLLGLSYPGGPAIQQAAAQGDASRLTLPRAWLDGSFDFSFSGLKTAVLNLVNPQRGAKLVAHGTSFSVNDIAAAFQEAVVEVLVEKTCRAAAHYKARMVLLGGGVAANQRLREQMRARSSVPVLTPPIALCTDNGAVIAAAAYFHFKQGRRSGWDLDVVPGLRLIKN